MANRNDIRNTDDIIIPELVGHITKASANSLFASPGLCTFTPAPESSAQVNKSDWTDFTPETRTTSGEGRSTNQTWSVSNQSIKPDALYLTASLDDDIGTAKSQMLMADMLTALIKAHDDKVIDVMVAGYANTSSTSGGDMIPLDDIDKVIDATAVLRARNVEGPFIGLISTREGANLKKAYTDVKVAGGAMQAQNLMNQGLTDVNGVVWVESPLLNRLTSSAGFIYKPESLVLAVRRLLNVNQFYDGRGLTNEYTASIIAKAAVVDADRGLELVNV